MSVEQVEPTTEDPAIHGVLVPPASARRTKSTVQFPYNDLDDVVRVAEGLHNKRGGGADVAQVAADLGQVPTSGAFRLRLSAARMFGLIDLDQRVVSLLPLGRAIVQGGPQVAARAEAFLSVELYHVIYNEYRDSVLPADPGLEEFIVAAGVTANQSSRARQVFSRSAKQAGFFEHGNNRLVRPSSGSTEGPVEPPAEPPGSTMDDSGKGGGGGDMLTDPMLSALFRRMLPKEGEPFPAEKRQLLFTALATNLDVIYGLPDQPVAMEIKHANRPTLPTPTVTIEPAQPAERSASD